MMPTPDDPLPEAPDDPDVELELEPDVPEDPPKPESCASPKQTNIRRRDNNVKTFLMLSIDRKMPRVEALRTQLK